MKIVCIGDSITAAGRNSNDATDLGNGYAKITCGKLKLLLTETEVTVINRGVNGRTIADILANFEVDVASENPDVVILEGGINDVRNAVNAEEEFNVSQFASDYQAIVNKVKALNAKLIMIEPFVIKVTPDKLRYRRALNLALKAIEEIGVASADAVVHLDEIFNGVCEGEPKEAKQWAEDGIHPTHRASRHIANIVIAKIQNKLIADA